MLVHQHHCLFLSFALVQRKLLSSYEIGTDATNYGDVDKTLYRGWAEEFCYDAVGLCTTNRDSARGK